MAIAGRLDRPVIFLARPSLPPTLGAPRGPFEPLGDPVWASYEDRLSYRIAIGDFHVNVPTGLLTVRDDPFSRSIRRAHQAEIDGQRFAIRSENLPDRRAGTITFEVIGAESLDLYADYVDAEGEVVVVRRPGAPNIEVNARARVTGYKPKELAAGMRQGDRQILLLATDLDVPEWPGPLAQTDKIVVRGQPLTMRALDDSTHRFAGVLFAYEIVAGS